MVEDTLSEHENIEVSPEEALENLIEILPEDRSEFENSEEDSHALWKNEILPKTRPFLKLVIQKLTTKLDKREIEVGYVGSLEGEVIELFVKSFTSRFLQTFSLRN